MKQIEAAFFLSVLLLGCAVERNSGVALSLTAVETAVSKTNTLTAGDEIGVFAHLDGTEEYFLEHVKFVVGADGRSLSTAPAVYYPEAKQAITFTAYLPFGGAWDGAVGTFSVPSDQTTAAALKQADLCWATASSTPVAAPVPLEFSHKMARLLIVTNEPTEKVAIPNVFSGGTLDIKTGTFTNTLKSSISTTGNELIVPAQPLTRLLLTVAGVEYTFEGAILLESAKTTSISLTFNPTTKTATLAGSSVGAWGTTSTTGNPTQAAVNTLAIHWPKCHPQSGSVDKVVLRIKDHTTNTTAEYTVSSGITYADQTFTVPFASTAVFYPYTIEDITLYQSGTWLHRSMNIVGPTITKRGVFAVGVRQPLNPPVASDYIKVGSLYWAKGNLVAVSKNNNRECKVGAPMDHGLYFQFGSLIGYKGGSLANGGTGAGSNPYTGSYLAWWGGAASYSWENDAMVWPSELVGTKTTWTDTTGEDIGTLTDYYFNYSLAPWSKKGNRIRGFAVSISGDTGSGTLSTGRYAKLGVGDPCTYYLGLPWRLPNGADFVSLTGARPDVWEQLSWPSVTGIWATEGQIFDGISGPGAWYGPGLGPGTGVPNVGSNVFFARAGMRNERGAFGAVSTHALYQGDEPYTWNWSADFVSEVTHGVAITCGPRAQGFNVRCVREL